MPLQAITFDAAGTLIHLEKPVGETYSEIAATYGIHATPADIETAFRSVWKKTPAPFSNQQGTFDEPTLSFRKSDREAKPQDSPIRNPERDWWKTLVRDVFAEANAETANRFDEFFDGLYDHFENPGCWHLDTDAILVLDEIAARGLKIGLLSNFDYRLRKILKGLDIFQHFQAIVLSGEIQASKPDPRMFATIQKAMKISDPACILHVGDDPDCDIAGAEHFGFRAFRVKPGKNPLRDVLSQLD